AIVMGDYVYIDGGEILQDDDNGDPTDEMPVQDNATISIYLGDSWTPDSITPNVMGKAEGVPILKDLVLWGEEDDSAFYMWGGQVSPLPGQPPIPNTNLWKFTVDGNGGGSWDVSNPSNAGLFQTFHRPSMGLGTSGSNAGYLLGGYLTPRSEPQLADESDFVQPIPGIISYNMTTRVWSNDSAAGYSLYGAGNLGQAVFLPSYGTDGLLAFMGGYNTGLETVRFDGTGLVSFDNITFYDPVSKTWYAQKATGDSPSPRAGFCAVAVAGQNGTHEIFVYGGRYDGTNEFLDDAYVLTIPGFNWFKIDYPSAQGRMSHSCHLVGKRQMLVIGGDDGELDTNRDHITNGLGILDMTEMAWTSGYDANAAEYESPQIVQDWYNQGGQDAVQWTSSDVEVLFASNSTGNSNNTSDASDPDSEDSGLNVGAIVGGVVGGVFGLLIVAGIIFWLVVRHRKKHNAPEKLALMGGPPPGVVYAQSPGILSELPDSSDRPPQELPPTNEVRKPRKPNDVYELH
ncbi:hypothetical protein BDY21DRAFT_286425, partial [Lineolata rhizophorae]